MQSVVLSNREIKPGEITNVIFDFGQVVLDWDPYYCYQELYTREQWNKLAEKYEFFSYNDRADAGEDFADIVASFRQSSPEKAEFLAVYIDNYLPSLTRRTPYTAEIIAALKSKGIKTYGLTNYPAQLIGLAREFAPAINEIDGLVVSGEEKVCKPNARIYEILMQRYNLDPHTCLFTDDRLENCQGALALGISSHQFKGAAGLCAALVEVGIFTDDEVAKILAK